MGSPDHLGKQMNKTKEVSTNTMVIGGKTSVEYRRCNYLEDPTISSYFLTRELLTCYSAIKHVDDKRNYYSTLIPELVWFLDLIEQYGEQILTSTVFQKKEKVVVNRSTSKSSIDEIDPDGHALLELSVSLTLDDLKAAYRKAAMKHHPDRGGNTNAMQIINRAYLTYHDYLCQEQFLEISDEVSAKRLPESVNGYSYLVNATLLQIYCDDWNLESAIGIVRMFLRTNFQGVTVTIASIDHYALAETAIALTKKLTIAKRTSDADIALEFTRIIYDIGGFHLNSFYEKALNQVNAIIAGEKSYGFKINHIRQAENALSLGVISRDKFEELKARLSAGDKEEELISRNLVETLNSGFQFVTLPYDKDVQRTQITIKNVPGILYFENLRIHDIPINNKSEYFNAFFETPTVELLRKYTYVRLVSYLLSLSDSLAKEFLDIVIAECKVIHAVHDSRKVKYKNTMLLINSIVDDVQLLRNCEDSERTNILKSIKFKYKYLTKRQSRFEVVI